MGMTKSLDLVFLFYNVLYFATFLQIQKSSPEKRDPRFSSQIKDLKRIGTQKRFRPAP